MRQFRAMLWTVMVAQVLLPSAPRAQVPDHLKCYKIKDSVAKITYTADLGGLAPEPGCQVKVPSKLLCVEATKTNVSPTPPGAPAGPAAGQFLCYKVKCPKGVPPVVTLVDQFGTHSVTPSAAQLLCAPAQAAPPTPTTTTNPASTTTTTNPAGSTTTSTPTTTTTTSTTLACGATGSPCSSNSDCCSGFCPLTGPGNHTCQDAPSTTTTTTSTTTTTTAPTRVCCFTESLGGGFVSIWGGSTCPVTNPPLLQGPAGSAPSGGLCVVNPPPGDCCQGASCETVSADVTCESLALVTVHNALCMPNGQCQ